MDSYAWPGYTTAEYGSGMPEINGGGGMDWLSLALGGANFLGGLFQNDYGQGRANAFLTQQQGRGQQLQNQLTQAQWYDLSRMAAAQRGNMLANTGLTNAQAGYTGAQTNYLRARQGWEGAREGQRGQMYQTARSLLGKDIYDPMETFAMANKAIAPLENQLQAQFASRGLGGGAVLGALANMRQQNALGHLMRGYENNAFAMAQRDQNLISQFS